jgi:hypothetical protein
MAETTDYLVFRKLVLTPIFRPRTWTQSSAKFILTSPACPDAHLHLKIFGFAFWEFAKPAHEHHLQVFLPAQALYSSI